MDSVISDLLAEIRAYCAAVQAAGGRIQPSTFGNYAVGDARFVARLEAGGQCLPRTMARVRQYMAKHPPQQRGRAA